MMKKILGAGMLLAVVYSAGAMACDREQALEQWDQAEQQGIILGAGEVNGVMSFAVDPGVWANVDLNVRQGMLNTFECIIAGPGHVLAKANVLTPGGRVLASWDGVKRELDIK